MVFLYQCTHTMDGGKHVILVLSRLTVYRLSHGYLSLIIDIFQNVILYVVVDVVYFLASFVPSDGLYGVCTISYIKNGHLWYISLYIKNCKIYVLC